MSKRTTGKVSSERPTPAPRRRKATAADAPSEVPDAQMLAVPTADDIATRAYFIAMERGFPGDPLSDWLAAERQLRDAVSS